jgi:hypothetical protein
LRYILGAICDRAGKIARMQLRSMDNVHETTHNPIGIADPIEHSADDRLAGLKYRPKSLKNIN